MCFSEFHINVWIDKHLPDAFIIENCIKRDTIYRRCISTLLSNMPLGRSNKPGRSELNGTRQLLIYVTYWAKAKYYK